MLRILIADDQDVVRQGLIKLIQEMELGLDEIMEAADGEEALKLAKEHKPDILLVDIMMPKLNGLELIEELKECGCTSHIVIISSYNDFDYTKKAISFRVDDYLLKPVSRDELYKLLVALKIRIASDSEKVEKLKEQECKYYFRLLYDYLTGQDVLASVREIMDGAGVQFHNPYYAVFLLQCESGDTGRLEDVRQGVNEKLRNAGFRFVSIGNDCDKLVYILNTSQDSSTCDHLVAGYAAEAPFVLKCGISSVMEGVQSLRKLYVQADTALKESKFRGVRVCRFQDIRNGLQPMIGMSEYVKLLDLFSRGRKLELDRLLEDIFFKLSGMVTNAGGAVNSLYNMLNYLYVNLNVVYPGICDMETVKSALNDAGSMLRLKVAVKESINEMFRHVEESNRKDCASHIVNYMINHVRNNYHTKVSLADIAEELSMNYNYISGLFTKKAGMTFSEFLTGFRLEKAAEMLKNGDYRMHEISDRCGFYDAKYFCKAFKRRYHMTPVEYRNKT